LRFKIETNISSSVSKLLATNVITLKLTDLRDIYNRCRYEAQLFMRVIVLYDRGHARSGVVRSVHN
jgi:hypothetical protein